MDTTVAVDRFDLPASARSVLRALAVDGPATRPQLSTALALSRPTMSVAMAELSRLGLVAGQGSSRGATGRSAVLYSLAAGAGHVLGVEIGATGVRAAAYTLDGREIGAAEERLAADQPTVTPEAADAAAGVVRTVRAEVGARFGPLREVVVAAPTLPTTGRGRGGSAGPSDGGLQADGTVRITDALDVPAGVPVTVENNVNCAAVAEHRFGVARDEQMFAYIQVGVKIGVGIVVDGRLMQGANGAAGEAAMLPFPWSPSHRPERAGLERFLGSDALMERCAASWPPAGAGSVPRDAKALFEAAASGHSAARRVVDQHAADIGRLVAGVVALLDPGLVVLGGGVGQNQLVLLEVRRVVRELAWDTEVTVGGLGDRATLLGAVHLAVGRALDSMA
ncbi:Sugar kinase of the NBD/HSP70 family, may contain an N-terminal HTH domain [Actinacidiphila alni]|uniref:Sugar kinase of the NBD/HSP70 family, may contain an N-terminal HTH domain n=1 Tax=Actinacidiphila alni TaxID=380248 RepID=A0A1I1XR07_9ACTN|nr:ROK family transcriptional regulator [Actinacidiphila alni]SFE07980.1 Sugar kinase of the NBD/HSP70 family, may contain an N-terminal HTH domain [Actinacidiphila alni]